jgi:hypothetical protein
LFSVLNEIRNFDIVSFSVTSGFNIFSWARQQPMLSQESSGC